MRSRRFVIPFLLIPNLCAGEKLTDMDRVKLIRGLTAEFANAKVVLPRSKKPLEIDTEGKWDRAKWEEMFRENGPAAKVGDQMQITKVTINNDNIVFEINGGLKTGSSWKDRIQVGGGMGRGTMAPIGSGRMSAGTAVVLKFPHDLEPIEAAEVKKLLSPVFQFDLHSATESYVENLPPEIKKAIEEKKAVEGMDKEQVQLALGKPRYKSRETKDGMELEDWVFGQPPGKIVFVTFNGNKVLKVKESYASLGGDLSAPAK
jgi:hypothetical protein